MTSIYVDWDGHHVKLTWIPTDQLPDRDKITSVHGYCFEGDKILLVHIKGRGFNIPGGHVENGETPEQAFVREAYEEGYVKGEIRYLGMTEISHEENPLFDPNGKYPLIGYQLFYRMDITERLPFKRENESTAFARNFVQNSRFPGHNDEFCTKFRSKQPIPGRNDEFCTKFRSKQPIPR